MSKDTYYGYGAGSGRGELGGSRVVGFGNGSSNSGGGGGTDCGYGAGIRRSFSDDHADYGSGSYVGGGYVTCTGLDQMPKQQQTHRWIGSEHMAFFTHDTGYGDGISYGSGTGTGFDLAAGSGSSRWDEIESDLPSLLLLYKGEI